MQQTTVTSASDSNSNSNSMCIDRDAVTKSATGSEAQRTAVENGAGGGGDEWEKVNNALANVQQAFESSSGAGGGGTIDSVVRHPALPGVRPAQQLWSAGDSASYPLYSDSGFAPANDALGHAATEGEAEAEADAEADAQLDASESGSERTQAHTLALMLQEQLDAINREIHMLQEEKLRAEALETQFYGTSMDAAAQMAPCTGAGAGTGLEPSTDALPLPYMAAAHSLQLQVPLFSGTDAAADTAPEQLYLSAVAPRELQLHLQTHTHAHAHEHNSPPLGMRVALEKYPENDLPINDLHLHARRTGTGSGPGSAPASASLSGSRLALKPPAGAEHLQQQQQPFSNPQAQSFPHPHLYHHQYPYPVAYEYEYEYDPNTSAASNLNSSPKPPPLFNAGSVPPAISRVRRLYMYLYLYLYCVAWHGMAWHTSVNDTICS